MECTDSASRTSAAAWLTTSSLLDLTRSFSWRSRLAASDRAASLTDASAVARAATACLHEPIIRM
eukprot:scaffold199666_cov24-Tisochrysis_lutea.AAC.2